MVKILAKIIRYWKFINYSVFAPIGDKLPIPQNFELSIISSVYAFISIGVADLLLLTTTSIVIAATGLVATLVLLFFRFELN